MPIAALPPETARTITSTLALSDATSVVKELIDNALDAKSTSVSIEISSNTVDVIQVKDDGCGIGIEDRQLLCRRGCTSKIRTIQDLASLGGTFLGFRGEALASIAELSTSVTVTTRVEGEVVASALRFGPNGKLLSSKSCSHPIGTTLRIQEFLTKTPVRKQAALKTSTKTLSKVKHLLQSYALARPQARFAFKVLKAKDEKSNWACAPSASNAALTEVVTKVIGKNTAIQCTQHDLQADDYGIRAVMLNAASDFSEVINEQQYCSVDGRPVATERGFVKELIKVYKDYVQAVAGPERKLRKPFLYLQIVCPQNSYDVNIEPAKDEVLFYDSSRLHNLFKQMLDTVYGVSSSSQVQEPQKPTTPLQTRLPSSFDLLLARNPTPKATTSVANDNIATTTPTQSATELLPTSSVGTADVDTQYTPYTPRANMYGVDEDDVFDAASSTDLLPLDEDATESHDRTIHNPWTTAKMNVKTTSQTGSSGRLTLSPRRSPHTLTNNRNERELEDILEFERQKRTAIAEQRRQAMNRRFKAQLPTPSPTQSGSVRSPAGSRKDECTTEGTGSTPNIHVTEDFERRFGGHDITRNQQAEPSNPHMNRYRAAVRALRTPPAHERSRQIIEVDTASKDTPPPIPESDSRAYLMCHRQKLRQQEVQQEEGTTGTRIKLKRVKSRKLPLETVPVDAALHGLSTNLECDAMSVKQSSEALAALDEFVKKGNVAVATWSPFTRKVEEWQTSLQNMVQARYRPQLLGNEEATTRDDANFDFVVNLRIALKAHVEADTYD